MQRRDILATNVATDGFWKRVLDDFGARQQVIEVKNYSPMTEDDFRQAHGYSGKDNGRLVIIVNRAKEEPPTEKERGWIKELWDRHGTLIFLVSADFLARSISKLRKPERVDYVDTHLGRFLDRYQRDYLQLRHRTRRRRRRKSRRA